MIENQEYLSLLESLFVQKGEHRLKRLRCPHHTVNNSKWPVEVEDYENDSTLMHCGCSRIKGAVEKYLVNNGILGVRNEEAQTSLLSLTEWEWHKTEHIMAALFGFRAIWLFDKEVMRAGLQRYLDNL